MRSQDEFLGLYPVADAATRRYLLMQVPDLPVHFDSDEIEALLDKARLDQDRRIAAQALLAWDRMGPRLVLYAHGLDAERLGLWSTVALEVRGEAPAPQTAGDEPAPGQGAAFAALLEPCRSAIIGFAARAGPTGDLAREVLGLAPVAGATEVLRAGACDPLRAVTSLAALSRLDPAGAAEMIAGGRQLPLWIRTLASGAVGGDGCFQLALKAAVRGDEDARWGAAHALPAFVHQDWAPLARALIDADRGWIQIVVIGSLATLALKLSPLPDDARTKLTALLDHCLKRGEHDLIRIAAIRAMGMVSRDHTVKRALRCLDRGSPLLKAAAIETLIRVDRDLPGLAGRLIELAGSGPTKLRGTATLGLLKLDREAALRAALDLVRDPVPTARLEGCYCLGYLQCRTALDVLTTIAANDPFLPGAMQALKSLAHYPEREAAPALLSLLEHQNPQVALGALKVLSHFPGESQGGIVPLLVKLEKRLKPDDARVALRHTGRLGPAVAGIAGYLSTRRAPALAVGALEGLARAGQVPPDLAREAASAPDPHLAIRGAALQVIGGDGAGLGHLARHLGGERHTPLALASVRELAVVAAEAGRGGRHRELQQLLCPRTRAPVEVAFRPGTPVARAVGAPVRTRDSTEVLQKAVGTDRAGLLAGLAKALAQPTSRGDARGHANWAFDLTYLQVRGLALLSGARALAHPALLIAVAVAGLMSAVVFGVGGSEPGKLTPADPASLDTLLVVGGLVGSPGPGPGAGSIAPGSPMTPGETWSTRAGQKISLASHSGLSVVIFPSTEVKLVKVPRRSSREQDLVLDLVRGALVVDARIGDPKVVVRLKSAHGEVTGSQLALRAALDAQDLTVHVGAGRATVGSRTGLGEVELAAGQTATLKAGSAPTAAAKFSMLGVEWR